MSRPEFDRLIPIDAKRKGFDTNIGPSVAVENLMYYLYGDTYEIVQHFQAPSSGLLGILNDLRIPTSRSIHLKQAFIDGSVQNDIALPNAKELRNIATVLKYPYPFKTSFKPYNGQIAYYKFTDISRYSFQPDPSEDSVLPYQIITQIGFNADFLTRAIAGQFEIVSGVQINGKKDFKLQSVYKLKRTWSPETLSFLSNRITLTNIDSLIRQLNAAVYISQTFSGGRFSGK